MESKSCEDKKLRTKNRIMNFKKNQIRKRLLNVSSNCVKQKKKCERKKPIISEPDIFAQNISKPITSEPDIFAQNISKPITSEPIISAALLKELTGSDIIFTRNVSQPIQSSFFFPDYTPQSTNVSMVSLSPIMFTHSNNTNLSPISYPVSPIIPDSDNLFKT